MEMGMRYLLLLAALLLPPDGAPYLLTDNGAGRILRVAPK
jgi:hypothetical protein